MRIRWFDRILIALSGLALAALGVLFCLTGLHAPQLVYDFGIKLIQAFLGLRAVHWVRDGAWFALLPLIVAGLALIAWGVRQWISLIPKRRREAFFTATQIDFGTLSIAQPALEHLVQKCVADHPEMTVSKINIVNEGEKAMIRLRATMRSGVSMPKVTAALQKEVVGYLSECAGIDVSGVQVIVEDTTPALLLSESAQPMRALPESARGSIKDPVLPSTEPKYDDESPAVAPAAQAVVDAELEAGLRDMEKEAKLGVPPNPIFAAALGFPPEPVSVPLEARAESDAEPFAESGEFSEEPVLDPMFDFEIPAERIASDDDKAEGGGIHGGS